jgi:hypothetical protein
VGPHLRELLKYIQYDADLDKYISTARHSAARLTIKKLCALFTTSHTRRSEELFFIRKEARETALMCNGPVLQYYTFNSPTFYESRSRSSLRVLWNRLLDQERKQVFQLFHPAPRFNPSREHLSEVLANQQVTIHQSLELAPMLQQNENFLRCG